jgi:hypothetical protein
VRTSNPSAFNKLTFVVAEVIFGALDRNKFRFSTNQRCRVSFNVNRLFPGSCETVGEHHAREDYMFRLTNIEQAMRTD